MTTCRRPLAAILLTFLIVMPPVPSRAAAKPSFHVTEHKTKGEVRNCLFGDLNGDGFTDIVSISNVVSETSNSLTRWVNVFPGSAPGQFAETAAQVFQVPADAAVVDLGEVDPASKGVELVFLTADGVIYHPWQGGRLAETPRKLMDEPTMFPLVDESLAVSFDFVKDWTGDGRDDVLVPGFRKTAVWTQGEQGWARQQYLEIPLRTLWGSHWENDVIINRVSQLQFRGAFDFPDIVIGDISGDGVPDLVSIRFDWMSVFRGKGGGRYEEKPYEIDLGLFKFSAILKYSRLQAVTRLFLVDFNKDGLLDAYTTRLKITNLATFDVDLETSVFLNRKGSFPKEPDRKWNTSGFSETARSGDFNNDGYPDIVVQYFPFGITQILRFLTLGSLGIQYDYYYYDKAKGGFPIKPSKSDSWSFSFKTKPTNSSFGASYLFGNDFNGDGLKDFMQARGPEELTVALSTPSKYGSEAVNVKVPCSFFTYGVDLNRDSRDELVIRYENMPTRNHIFAIVSPSGPELKPAK